MKSKTYSLGFLLDSSARFLPPAAWRKPPTRLSSWNPARIAGIEAMLPEQPAGFGGQSATVAFGRTRRPAPLWASYSPKRGTATLTNLNNSELQEVTVKS